VSPSGTERHAVLASDLVEEFRAPIVDSLVLCLVSQNRCSEDFVHRDGGCYLNDSGRSKYLKPFYKGWRKKFKQILERTAKWDLLTQQVKAYKGFV